jgi:hypothetical protein
MSHKPSTPRTGSKAKKTVVRQPEAEKVPSKKSVSQKIGFVSPKQTNTKVKMGKDGAPFKLVHSGGTHGVYANGPKGVTRLCGALGPMGQTTDPDGGNPAIRVRFRTYVDTVKFYDICQQQLNTNTGLKKQRLNTDTPNVFHFCPAGLVQ